MPERTELDAALRGTVMRPGDPGYGAAALAWNARFDDAQPTLVRVVDSGDVQTVVDFARDNALPLRARSGGHSFAGYPTGDCLVVDLGALISVEVDPGGVQATLGAGCTNLPTYRALWPHRMAVCAGVCPTVGITGLTCGGGLGMFSRRHGLTSDTLVEAEIVTADGRLLHASENENADLFWALRGGGGGTSGS
ncbi:MAG: FAD-dependent oxidoreductase [Thermoleophilaceae bacterium]|nr:FAD-dependent oxidoreductase [Thermoleophilaceae bacterium]